MILIFRERKFVFDTAENLVLTFGILVKESVLERSERIYMLCGKYGNEE